MKSLITVMWHCWKKTSKWHSCQLLQNTPCKVSYLDMEHEYHNLQPTLRVTRTASQSSADLTMSHSPFRLNAAVPSATPSTEKSLLSGFLLKIPQNMDSNRCEYSLYQHRTYSSFQTTSEATLHVFFFPPCWNSLSQDFTWFIEINLVAFFL